MKVIHERGRLGFQEMNSQAEDEKFPGRSYAKDLENRQLGLEKEGRGLQENYYKK